MDQVSQSDASFQGLWCHSAQPVIINVLKQDGELVGTAAVYTYTSEAWMERGCLEVARAGKMPFSHQAPLPEPDQSCMSQITMLAMHASLGQTLASNKELG